MIYQSKHIQYLLKWFSFPNLLYNSILFRHQGRLIYLKLQNRMNKSISICCYPSELISEMSLILCPLFHGELKWVLFFLLSSSPSTNDCTNDQLISQTSSLCAWDKVHIAELFSKTLEGLLLRVRCWQWKRRKMGRKTKKRGGLGKLVGEEQKHRSGESAEHDQAWEGKRKVEQVSPAEWGDGGPRCVLETRKWKNRKSTKISHSSLKGWLGSRILLPHLSWVQAYLRAKFVMELPGGREL